MKFEEILKHNLPTIHCSSEKEARRILRLAHQHRFRWVSDEPCVEITRWKVYEENTCYCFHTVDESVSYDPIEYFRDSRHNYSIFSSYSIENINLVKEYKVWNM